ncbi:sensor domain-containing protein [Plantactinospora sp. S1510]|uniref:histidine kinase n=1 Tax=Plantactinospora alkalitolerans TaxID=2789879 RepID=A0ABS0GU52_9ACTN|nr:sensor histidine kinase [Plantactinospora alkalitolerans]MBF9129711.1 sensor domain-containing protein [Plantactinospora alkalitolerans]
MRLRQARREFGYALVSLPLAVLGLAYVVITIVLGGMLSLTLLGLPLLAAGVLGARAWGTLHRRLARAALGVRLAAPRPIRRPVGPVGFVRAGLGDGAGWRALAYLFVKLPTAVLTAGVAVALVCYSAVFLSYPFWWWAVRPVNTDSAGRPHRAALQLGDFFFDTWPRAILLGGIGVALLLIGPRILHCVLLLDRLLIRALLGPTSLDDRLTDLEETRAHAVDDSAALLRRIERDLHDGAQAQLVALAMKLGMAKEKLGDAVPADARVLVETAHSDAKAAITELRDLARGIHPPMLDNGLEAALTTLVARCAVPVALRVEISDRPSPAIETIAYFCAAELLTNVAKHSRAGRATVEVCQRGRRLWIRVGDDGTGGASFGAARRSGTALPAGGLVGLRERVRTVDGSIRIESPPGGPTLVSVELPVHS